MNLPVGGGIARVEKIGAQLRRAGLPSNVAVVFVKGPYSCRFGHSWGATREGQAKSRARLRSRLHELMGDRGLRERAVSLRTSSARWR